MIRCTTQENETHNYKPSPPVRKHNRELTGHKHEAVFPIILPHSLIAFLKPNIEALEDADSRHADF